jgi:Tfp pilus assembly protein PilE
MHKIKKINKSLGFGLIELMVSISIVVLVTSIILAKHESYNSAILLRSQAYDVALKMREVQLLSVSASGQDGEYRNSMGLYFNTANSYYYVFTDNDEDNYYDSGEEVGQRINLDKRFELSSLTLVDGTASPQTAKELSVVFERPNFDAKFFTDENDEATGVSGVELGVRLKGTTGSGTGELRTLEVSRTGQIIVKPTNTEERPGNNYGIQDPITDPKDPGTDPVIEDPKTEGGNETSGKGSQESF